MERISVSLLHSYLDFFYAQEIFDKMQSMFKKKCFGCQNDCLSQRDHVCISLSTGQQLELYMQDILSDLDDNIVLAKLSNALGCFDVSLETHKRQTIVTEYRERKMTSFEWKNKINTTITRLVFLNARLF